MHTSASSCATHAIDAYYSNPLGKLTIMLQSSQASPSPRGSRSPDSHLTSSSSSLSISFNLTPATHSQPPSPVSSVFSSASSTHSSMASSNEADLVSTEVENHYFSSNPPPKDLAKHTAQAEEFINFHNAAGRRVCLVTSGGTTVPLEKQTVRFIDNFSAGTRGATSAEYFLEAGYAVIFLHRQFSLLPYSRHYSHATDCFLDFLTEGQDGTVVAKPEFTPKMLSVLRKYHSARSQNLLLTVPFVTIGDYLHELRAVARLMQPLGPDGLLYLAAAASDFFLPQDRMSEHKIQSTGAADGVKKAAEKPETKAPSKGSSSEEETFDNFDSSPQVPRSKRLVVDLDPVPKFLKNLVDGWAPQCMIVSFKLETDPGKLTLSTSTIFILARSLFSKFNLTFFPQCRASRRVLTTVKKYSCTKRNMRSSDTATTSSSATCCPPVNGRSYSSLPPARTSGSACPLSRPQQATRGRSARLRRRSPWTLARCQREIPRSRSRASSSLP